ARRHGAPVAPGQSAAPYRESGAVVRRARSRLGKADADAPVVAALVFDLQDLHFRDIAQRIQMRTAAGLAVEADDIDDAHLAVLGRRRRYRAAAQKAWHRLGYFEIFISTDHGKVLADGVVHWAGQRPEFVVVGARHVEIHARGGVVG